MISKTLNIMCDENSCVVFTFLENECFEVVIKDKHWNLCSVLKEVKYFNLLKSKEINIEKLKIPLKKSKNACV